MFYTYILHSISHPAQYYTEFTSDLKARLEKTTPEMFHIPQNMLHGN